MEDLARGGAGVGRAPDGRTVFTPLTLPGDRVRIRVVKEEKRYLHAELEEILTPSPQRVIPRCSVFGKCGGCDWQHVPYEMQWATKVRGIREALARASIPAPAPWAEFPAADPWNYRNRVQLRGRGSEIGFHARGSHGLVNIERCEIARPEINAALAEARARGQALGREYKVEIEVLRESARMTWDSPHGTAGFRQVNDAQNERLRTWVAEALMEGGPSALLDLYGGDGNLTSSLARRVDHVDVVDLGAPRERPPGIPENLRYHRAPVAAWLGRRQANDAKATHVVVDPPREGVGRELPVMLDSLRKLGARAVVAVGCDPDSWARDLKGWTGAGWRITRVAVLDLFPQTRHVEAVARLERS
ncbi:MAG: class I SAM-dependent RNA methyltransferase [Bdellovibrionales bacterium]|nr:class I SAM-dependent RNA methyltransferase [Bdellovibrionales bacterium]